MKHSCNSSVLSTFARYAGTNFHAGKMKFNIVKPVFSRVGIKFDIISAGKLHPGIFGLKKYSRIVAEGSNEPSVSCQSTFL
jgi:hypothetical protein